MLRAQLASTLLRARPAAIRAAPAFARPSSSSHGQETFESFTERYVNFFQSAQDLFEVQRGLNNCFAHDLVPAPAVVEAAVRAARRVNDYATAVRVFEGIKEKVENAKLIISIGGLKSDFNTGNFTYQIPTTRTVEVSL